jgi:branched-chain amino acid aminotransferase
LAYPIIDELAGDWLSAEGRLMRAADPAARELFQPAEQKMFYEVIRVVQSTPLFWEDHMARLAASVNNSLWISDSLYDESCRLIEANKLEGANLRIILTSGRHIIHMTKSYYPTPEARQSGVVTGVLNWERPDPNTKVILSDYKSAVAERFSRPGPFGPYFELLLADRQGFLTEGSRSNLFFIQGGDVISAPDDRILKGITRKYVYQAIGSTGLTVREGLLTMADVRKGTCTAAFLTGSPIDIVPIRAIEDRAFDPAAEPALYRIMASYKQIVDRYLDTHRFGCQTDHMIQGG